MMCQRCQGNGEIVLDWDAYLHPENLAAEEKSVAECPDCNGEGVIIFEPKPKTVFQEQLEIQKAARSAEPSPEATE